MREFAQEAPAPTRRVQESGEGGVGRERVPTGIDVGAGGVNDLRALMTAGGNVQMAAYAGGGAGAVQMRDAGGPGRTTSASQSSTSQLADGAWTEAEELEVVSSEGDGQTTTLRGGRSTTTSIGGHTTSKSQSVEVTEADPEGDRRAMAAALDARATAADSDAALADEDATVAKAERALIAAHVAELKAGNGSSEEIALAEEQLAQMDAQAAISKAEAQRQRTNAERLRQASSDVADGKTSPDAVKVKLERAGGGTEVVDADELDVAEQRKVVSKEEKTSTSSTTWTGKDAVGVTHTRGDETSTTDADGATTTTSSSVAVGGKVADGKATGTFSSTDASRSTAADGSGTGESTTTGLTGTVDTETGAVSGGGNHKRTQTTTNADGSSEERSGSVGATVGYDPTSKVASAGLDGSSTRKTTNADGTVNQTTVGGSGGMKLGDDELGANVGVNAATGTDKAQVGVKASAGGDLKVEVTWDAGREEFVVKVVGVVQGSAGKSVTGGNDKTAATGGGSVGGGGSVATTVVRRFSRSEAASLDPRLAAIISTDPAVAVGDAEIDALRSAVLGVGAVGRLERDVLDDAGAVAGMKEGESARRVRTVHAEAGASLGANGDGTGVSAGPRVGVSGSAKRTWTRTIQVTRGRDAVTIEIGFDEADDVGGQVSGGLGAAEGRIGRKDRSAEGASTVFEIPAAEADSALVDAILACDGPDALAALTEAHRDLVKLEKRRESEGTTNDHAVGALGGEVNASVASSTGGEVVMDHENQSLAGSNWTGERSETVGAKAGQILGTSESSSNTVTTTLTEDGATGTVSMADSESSSALGGLWKETKKTLVEIDLSEDDMRTLVGRAGDKDKWTSLCGDHRLLDAWITLRERLRKPKTRFAEAAIDPDGAKWLGRARALADFVAGSLVDEARTLLRRALYNFGSHGDIGTEEEFPFLLTYADGKKLWARLTGEVPPFTDELEALVLERDQNPDAAASDLTPWETRKDGYLDDLGTLRQGIDLGGYSSLRAQADMLGRVSRMETRLLAAWATLVGADGADRDERVSSPVRAAQVASQRETVETISSSIVSQTRQAREAFEGTLWNHWDDAWEEMEPCRDALDALEREWRIYAGWRRAEGATEDVIAEENEDFGYAYAKGRYDAAAAHFNDH